MALILPGFKDSPFTNLSLVTSFEMLWSPARSTINTMSVFNISLLVIPKEALFLFFPFLIKLLENTPEAFGSVGLCRLASTVVPILNVSGSQFAKIQQKSVNMLNFDQSEILVILKSIPRNPWTYCFPG